MPSISTSYAPSISRRIGSPERETELRGMGLEVWADRDAMRSTADPDTLARVVQAHKTGDAVAQAVLTLALVLAIGTVAIVLSVERASAAGFLMRGVMDHSATFGAVAVVGGAVLLATRSALRQIRVRARGHNR